MDSPSISVLIVDDVVAVRQDLAVALTLAGNIEIAGEAANGLEAVRLAEALEPAVVLMDLEMPRNDAERRGGSRSAALPAASFRH